MMPKPLLPIVLTACWALAGCVAAPPPPPPPALHAQVPPPHLVKHYVWQPGAWRRTGEDYAWVPGHYVQRVVARRWVRGYRDASGAWVAGHWG